MINKPWGNEEIIFKEGDLQLKKLYIKKGHRLSTQYHRFKTETMILIRGNAEIELKGITYEMTTERFACISPMDVHRISGITDCEILELSIGKDIDIVRLEDDYGRIK